MTHPKVHTCHEDRVHHIVPLATKFSASSGVPLDNELWVEVMATMIRNRQADIYFITENDRWTGAPVAFMSVYYAPNPFNGQQQIIEQAWYVDESERGQPHGWVLLRHLDSVAKDIGACRIIMAHMDNAVGDRLRHILPRFGYSPLEVTYSKELL